MAYQYIWKHQLLGKHISTVDGLPVEIIRPGIHNHDSGPDFLNAKLRIKDIDWVGNVEIHIKASDWYAHHHDTDGAYTNVILHVVATDDTRIRDKQGREILQAVIGIPVSFIQMYDEMTKDIGRPACSGRLHEINELQMRSWLETLAVERLQQKSERILSMATGLDNDWEQVCFATMARALGFGLNSEPFEMLGRSLPLKIIHHHCDNPLQLEALLFGQAGMLDTGSHILDEYYQLLCREYFFLARKYGLRPMRKDIWKYSRTRPQNFPHRRIAMLSRMLLGGFRMMSELSNPAFSAEAFKDYLSVRATGYWESHIDFEMEGRGISCELSAASKDLLLINFAAPMMYAYSSWRGDIELGERALDIWRKVKPERNSIIKSWQGEGIAATNAGDTQALLQMRKEYCDRHRCPECRIGHLLLRKEACK